VVHALESLQIQGDDKVSCIHHAASVYLIRLLKVTKHFYFIFLFPFFKPADVHAMA
jgi:hypothetical protein